MTEVTWQALPPMPVEVMTATGWKPAQRLGSLGLRVVVRWDRGDRAGRLGWVLPAQVRPLSFS